jgi:hypothetical protein
MRTRTGTGLCLLACCCAALAACTAAAPKGPNTTVSTPGVGRPPPPASVQAALSGEAFTPYAALGTSNDDGLAPGESNYALDAACMSAAGYPGAADDVTLVVRGYLSFSRPWGPWGYLGAAGAQQYGFQIVPGSFLSVMGIGAGPPDSASPSPAEQAAASKCGTIELDFANAVAAGPLAFIGTLGDDSGTDVQNDRAVQAATQAWSACMAKNGYSFGQPQAAGRQEQGAIYGGNGSDINTAAPVSASVQRAQLAAAVTDAGCTQSSDLAGIYFAVQASYERQLVTANQQALSAAVSAYRAAYKKELTKLAALLRTAKAQPFPQAKRPARRGRPTG